MPQWKDAEKHAKAFQDGWLKLFDFIKNHEIGHSTVTHTVIGIYQGKKRHLSVEGCSQEDLEPAAKKLCDDGPKKDFIDAWKKAQAEYHKNVGTHINNVWDVMLSGADIETGYDSTKNDY